MKSKTLIDNINEMENKSGINKLSIRRKKPELHKTDTKFKSNYWHTIPPQ